MVLTRLFGAGGRRSLLLSTAFILASQGAYAATYYVATNGSDSNSGSASAPFATLQKGANAARAGDTVIVRNGTYGHVSAVTGGDSADYISAPVTLWNSGSSSAWITIKAENKWGAKLDCEMICDAYIDLKNSSYVSIEGFVITRGFKEGIHSNDAAHHIALRGNRIEYIANRNSSTNIGQDGMYTNPNCHDFIIDGNIFHHIGRTNTSHLDHGLYLRGYNYTVTNNVFYNHKSGWAIQLADGASNVTIANNTFAFGADHKDGHIMLWNTQNNLKIQNNIFYSPRSYAIDRYASSVSSCTIERNLIYGASAVAANTSGCSLGSNQIGGDPRFVNASAADFRVQSGGAGIDAGMNLSVVTKDFDGASRPQGTSTDIGAYEFGSVAAAGPVISGISVSSITSTSAIVTWMTNKAGTSYVDYGVGSYTNKSAENTSLVTLHSVVLNNLSPSTQYQFRAASRDSAGTLTVSGNGTFTTTAAAVTPTSPTAPTPSTPSAPTSSGNTSTGMIGQWDFAEGRGTTAGDTSGNGNHGTMQGAYWTRSGCYACAWFNGYSSSVVVKDSPSLQLTNQMTVTIWMNANTYNRSDARLISKRYDWDVKLNGSGMYPQFTAAGAYATLNQPLSTGRWNHVVFTFSNGTVKGYINGQPVSFQQNTFNGSQRLPTYQYGLFLGTMGDGSSFFSGFMDDVRIYNRALTDADVATLYSTTKH